MKKTVLLIAAACMVFGYEAQVKPFETYNIAASVAGKVVSAKKDSEATVYKGVIVKLDDSQNLIDLQNVKNQINITKNEIQNQQQIVKRKYDTYKRYQKLTTKSQEQKNLKFYDYMAAKNQLFSLQSRLSDLIAKKKSIEDIIGKKNIKADGYIENIIVKKGEYVAPGQRVAVVDDINKEKLTVYVPIDKTDTIKNKTVYINGKKSGFKIYKIWRIPDTKYITSYKVELVGRGLKFGNIVNVEFR